MKKDNRKMVVAAIYSLLLVMMFGCETDNVQTLEQRNWQLVWSDEFNGAAGFSPDAAKWEFDIGVGPNNDGWGNAELEYYTEPASECISGWQWQFSDYGQTRVIFRFGIYFCPY